MIPYESIFLLPIIMAVMNRVRGTGQEDFPIKIPFLKNGAILAAFVLAGFFAVWTPGFDQSTAFTFALIAMTYMGGESFGWGKWLQAIPLIARGATQEDYNVSNVARRDTGKENGIHAIANTIFKETKNYKMYTYLALIVRGWYWWIPVFGTLVYLGIVDLIPAVAAVAALGIVFPLCYVISYNVKADHYWGRGEYIYGFFQGLAIAAAVTVS